MSRHEFWCEKHASLPSKVEIAGVDCHCNGAAARRKGYRTSPPSPLTSMLMAEQFVFHPFGEELKINIEDGGAGGERIRSMRVTHLATPAFLDLHGTHETVQPPFTDPRPALMQTIAWHGTPAKLAINSKHSI